MGSVHRRRNDGSWEGVVPAAYVDPALAGVEKHDLIGPADGAATYRARYSTYRPGDAPRSSAIRTTTGS